MRLDIIIPVIMSCALLWWIGRGTSWTNRGIVLVITLVVVVVVLLLERSLM